MASMRKRVAPRSQDKEQSLSASSTTLHHHHHQQQHVALIIEDEPQQQLPAYLQRAPPPKPPLFLPDKHYRAFLAGRPASRRSSWFDGQKCARGCAGFSLIAIAFLLFVAMLAERQPLYIKGVRPYYSPTSNVVANVYSSSSSSTSYSSSAKRHSVALAPVIVSNCHRAAIMYFVTFMISVMYGWNVWWRIKARLRRRHYSDIPDATSCISTTATTANASSTIPTFHNAFDRNGGVRNDDDDDDNDSLPLYHGNGGGYSIFQKVTKWRRAQRKKPKRG